MRLLHGPDVPDAARLVLSGVADRLPPLDGRFISLEFRPQLTAHRGNLLTGEPQRGAEVHAAAFIRQRRIVLESGLLKTPNALRLIVAHEIFHFVWARFGNVARREYRALLMSELGAGARGELGESSGVKKRLLAPQEYRDTKSNRWRDYVCESFCDTAAWLYSGVQSHSDFDLANRWLVRRRAWLRAKFATTRTC